MSSNIDDDEGDSSTESGSSQQEFAATTSDALTAGACPGQGVQRAAQSTHFIRMFYDIEGATPSCSEATSLSDAAAGAVGASANDTIVKIVTIGEASRRLRNKQDRHLQSISRIEQTFLAQGADAAQALGARLEEARSDGTLSQAVQEAAPSGATGVQLPPATVRLEVGQLAMPSSSPSPSTSPSSSSAPTASGTPAASPSPSPSSSSAPTASGIPAASSSTSSSPSPSTSSSPSTTAKPTSTTSATPSTSSSGTPAATSTASATPMPSATATPSTTATTSTTPSTTPSVSPTPSTSPVSRVMEVAMVSIDTGAALNTTDAEVTVRNLRTGLVATNGIIQSSGNGKLRFRIFGEDMHEVVAKADGYVQVTPLLVNTAAAEQNSNDDSWFPVWMASRDGIHPDITRVVATNARRPADFELSGIVGNTSKTLVHAAAGINRGNGDHPEWCKAHHETPTCLYESTALSSERDAWKYPGWDFEMLQITDSNSSCRSDAVDPSMEAMTCHVRIMLFEYSPGGIYNVDDPTDDSEAYYMHHESEVDESFVPRVILGPNGYNASMRPSTFHYHPSPAISVVMPNGSNETITIRASDVVTQETKNHAARTGAWCVEWFVGSLDLVTQELSDYRDNGVSWVLEEFFMTNWWEGYVWDAVEGTVTSRNESFVPSNVSTYPFLCSIPPTLLGDTYAANIYDDDQIYEKMKTTYMAQYIAMYLEPDLFRHADDDTKTVDDEDYQVHTYNTRKVDRSRKVGFRRLMDTNGMSDVSKDTVLRVERLLANRDPETGEMLAHATQVPEHLPEGARKQLMRRSMFQGRDHARPWLTEDGKPLLY